MRYKIYTQKKVDNRKNLKRKIFTFRKNYERTYLGSENLNGKYILHRKKWSIVKKHIYLSQKWWVDGKKCKVIIGIMSQHNDPNIFESKYVKNK